MENKRSRNEHPNQFKLKVIQTCLWFALWQRLLDLMQSKLIRCYFCFYESIYSTFCICCSHSHIVSDTCKLCLYKNKCNVWNGSLVKECSNCMMRLLKISKKDGYTLFKHSFPKMSSRYCGFQVIKICASAMEVNSSVCS